MKINKIRPLEANFTEVLESIALVPERLYFYGKMPDFADFGGKRPKCVAIVGSRRNTKYGEEVAYRAAYELAKRGVVIISGLAYGIDSTAHRAALDAGGVTVAVLGTEIDHIYPKAHEGLARKIVENGGMIMSEYPSGAKLHPKASFLSRNRIVSGLSDAVIVVEAASKSGTLSTAAHALDQGKDIFAVPGPITSPLSVGCNRLIRQGARPFLGFEDVLEVIAPEKLEQAKLVFGDTEEENKIIGLIAEGIRDGEEIFERISMKPAEFSQIITMMEIKGYVRALGANQWALK
jgi:DNA processing protein